jgi:glycosyltransferase involved in cell wall biosynthesis
VPIVQLAVHSFRHPSALAAARHLGAYVREHGIRLVHSFDVPSTLFTVPAGKALTGAVVLSSQRAHRDLTPGPRRYLLRITDRIADGIVVNCEAIVRDLVVGEGVPRDRVHVCYNGIDLREFHPRAARLPHPGVDSESITIGVVCALRPEKNLLSLVEAFARVRARISKLQLLIVGSGPSLADVRSRAGQLGVLEDCVFEPTTDRVAEWLRRMDVFVLPSRSEALSNALMEAMACGCAAVASRVGGNVELIEHGRTGLLYESGNVAELGAALESLAGNEVLRRQLGAAAAVRIAERFSIARSAERMGEIYSSFVGSPLASSSRLAPR